ncbi:MAG: hypothetical protein U0637_00185 [Phycisphaerales bacterium]
MKRASAVLAGLTIALSLGACAHQVRTATPPPDARTQNAGKARELAAQAESAAKDGKLDHAIELYRMSLANYPDFGAAWNNLGLLLWKRAQGTDIMQAGQAFTQAAAILHDDPTPYRNLGHLYQARGFSEQALEHFANALKVDPYDLDSLRGAATAGKVLHKSDAAALERLQRAQMIENDPKWRDIITRERIRVENDLREGADRT